MGLYEQDFYGWLTRQAELLRAGRLSEADIEHIAEELEDMGKSERKSLESELTVLLMHLLKWQYQPGKRSVSWESSIIEHRSRVLDELEDSPSLKHVLPQVFLRAYKYGRAKASAQTGKPIRAFPESCPYTLEQALDPEFWPEA